MPIKFGTYNIRNGRNRGLESALRGMSQANIDLGVFQETKCTDGVYTRALAGYRVVATDTPSRHRGPNVISFEVVTIRRRWYIIGCYIAPDDARTIERVVTALGDQPRGTALIVAGDFNTDLGEMASDGRGTEIAAAITEAGIEDMTALFLGRKCAVISSSPASVITAAISVPLLSLAISPRSVLKSPATMRAVPCG